MIKQNPITSQLVFLDREGTNSLISTVREKIPRYNGIKPMKIELGDVKYDKHRSAIEPCLITEWRTNGLSEDNLNKLDMLVGELEQSSENRLRSPEGRKATIKDYKSIRNRITPSLRGYHLGGSSWRNYGLFVGRKFNSEEDAKLLPRKQRGTWLAEGDSRIELRLPLTSTNLHALEYMVRISSVLSPKQTSYQLGDMICDLYRSLNAIQIGHATTDELTGLEEIIDFMRWTMFAPSMSPSAQTYGLKSQSVMLAGVPGLGKTTIAKALASEENGSLFVPIEAITLVESLGEKQNEKNSLYHSARRLQDRANVDVALFCDDIESAMLRPDEGRLSPEYLAGTSSLLNKLQGVSSNNMLLSGSTNNPFVIDERFLEFGRVGYILHMPLPNEQSRIKTFEIHTRDKPIATDVNFNKLGQPTEGFTNRVITEVCNRAAEFALKRAAAGIQKIGESVFQTTKRVTPEVASDYPISQEDFQSALKVVKKHIKLDNIKELDRKIQKFCSDYNEGIGFIR